MARGFNIWEPAPIARAKGNIPAIVASAVMQIGRKRRRPAWIIASRAERPKRAKALLGVQQQDAVFRDDADHHDHAHERSHIERGAGDQQGEQAPE